MSLMVPRMGGSPYETEQAIAASIQGWVTDNNTWQYVSEFAPTYVVSVSADATTTLSPGMRWRAYQGGVLRQAIITAVGSYSGGVTEITLYVGTDYVVTDDELEEVAYSSEKAPFGFPLNPEKWTVTRIYSSTTSQASPSSGTYYNIGSVSINIPIGVWNVTYRVYVQNVISGAAKADIFVTLSTANNSESDVANTLAIIAYGNGQLDLLFEKAVPIVLNLSSRTTYYLNEATINSSTQLTIFGGTLPVVIRAVCAYL